MQLREHGTSLSFDRLTRLVQYLVPACWHRGDLGLRCLRFADNGLCQRFDAVNNLLRIKAAFAGKQLPVSPSEVVTPRFARDFLCQVLRDVLPNLGAHDVVCVFQRKAATDSKGRRAGFQLKAATAEVV